MPEQKKTEEQLRHEIRRKFDFSEDNDKERIEKALESEKDRFKAVQKKQELKEELKELKESGKPDGKDKDPVGNEQGSEPQLSSKDSARLMQAKIPVDDWDSVIEWVKFKRQSNPKYSVKEGLNDVVLKATLGEKAELRKTAEASATGKAKRGSNKTSGEDLLAKAENDNELPESDEDMQKLAKARLGLK